MFFYVLCNAVSVRMWSSSAVGAPAFCPLTDGGAAGGRSAPFL